MAEQDGKIPGLPITNTLRLLALPEDLLKLVEEEQLSAGHARALLGAPTAELQRQAAKKVIADGLSVRQTEALVKALQREKKAPPKQAGALRAPACLGGALLFRWRV